MREELLTNDRIDAVFVKTATRFRPKEALIMLAGIERATAGFSLPAIDLSRNNTPLLIPVSSCRFVPGSKLFRLLPFFTK